VLITKSEGGDEGRGNGSILNDENGVDGLLGRIKKDISFMIGGS